MRRLLYNIVVASLIFVITDCRDPFVPDFESGENDYLVVEGYINVGEKAVTSITLTRVSPIGAIEPVFETGATVVIENQYNEKFPVSEKEEGKYMTDSLNLDPAIQYRLLITANKGNEYASSFVQPKITPEIDSIFWRWENDGIHVYVTTHDTQRKSLFYKWTFEETWEVRSDFRSEYSYENDIMVKRSGTQQNQLFMCWAHRESDALRFASSVQNGNDQIMYSLINHGHFSEKLKYNYSMLVRQRVMTEDEYNYLYLIQKNTSVTGSLFDPMPAELHGNIESLSSSGQEVVGYVGAYTTQAKRFFIRAEELDIRYAPGCQPRIVTEDSFHYYFELSDYLPIDSLRVNVFGLQEFSAGTEFCTDCRLRGSPIRPDFFRE